MPIHGPLTYFLDPKAQANIIVTAAAGVFQSEQTRLSRERAKNVLFSELLLGQDVLGHDKQRASAIAVHYDCVLDCVLPTICYCVLQVHFCVLLDFLNSSEHGPFPEHPHTKPPDCARSRAADYAVLHHSRRILYPI